MAPLGPNARGYIAGLLDLKGNAYHSRKGGLTLYINGVKSPEMQRDLVRWIGGGYLKEDSSEGERRGCTLHCNQPHIHFARVSIRYIVTGLRALCVLHTLEPSLFEWRRKFSSPYHEAIQRIDVVSATKDGETIMKDMASRGWEVP